MTRAILYILVGYPGAGKTTTSLLLRQLTGATHLWADHERRAMFSEPTHSHEESQALYDKLNQRTEQLLAAGTSVIFDTGFNFRRDRDHLRQIAAHAGAETKLIWIQIDKDLAQRRAQTDGHASTNKYPAQMPHADFERITSHLEPPTADEEPIILDGTRLNAGYVAGQLGEL